MSISQPINRLVNDSKRWLHIHFSVYKWPEMITKIDVLIDLKTFDRTHYIQDVITYLFLLHITLHQVDATQRNASQQIEQRKRKRMRNWMKKHKISSSFYSHHFIGKSFSVLCSIHKHILCYRRFRQIHFNCFKGFRIVPWTLKINSSLQKHYGCTSAFILLTSCFILCIISLCFALFMNSLIIIATV